MCVSVAGVVVCPLVDVLLNTPQLVEDSTQCVLRVHLSPISVAQQCINTGHWQ